MYLPTEQEQALSLVLADARRGEPAPTAVGDVGDAAVCVMPVGRAGALHPAQQDPAHAGVRSVHVRSATQERCRRRALTGRDGPLAAPASRLPPRFLACTFASALALVVLRGLFFMMM